MSRFLVLLFIIIGAGCRRERTARPVPPIEASTVARVDTVVVTREAEALPPPGTPGTICLSTGFPMPMLVTSAGDTLLGEARLPLRKLPAGLVLEGVYAQGQSWLSRGMPITFERRTYRKAGAVVTMQCEDLKQVGTHANVPLFAPLTAPSPLELFYVPVAPGRFQAYRTTLPPRRQ
jgi:hypothetical protein